METRTANIIVNAPGGTASKGSKTYKISLPTSWIEQLGIDSADRNVELTFDGEKITITKSCTAKQFAEKEDKALIEDAYRELKASPLLVDESVRGLENNILAGCKTILDMAQTKQYDEMRKQIAWVSQLIYLRKNSEI